MNLLRAILFPVAMLAAIIDGCFDVFWYCVIVGRPAWLRGRETPIHAARDFFRRS